MKTAAASTTLPIEIPGTGIVAMKLRMSVSVDDKLLPFLKTVGLEGEALLNYMSTLLDEATLAVDGSVRGLIVSNTEEE